jgi:RNA polymerase sigma-70 factor (ECF subfamily)
MLTEEATIAMPPMPTWYRARRRRELPAPSAAGARQPLARGRHARQRPAGLRLYRWSDEEGAFVAHDIIVLTLDGARISELVAFLEPDAFRRFGLPAEWSAA